MTNMLSATGTLHRTSEIREISSRFTLREFVLEIEGKFQPQLVQFQLVNDRIDLLEGIDVGDTISLSFDLRGREHTGRDGVLRVYNSLDVWRIAIIQKSVPLTEEHRKFLPAQEPEHAESEPQKANPVAATDEEIPF